MIPPFARLLGLAALFVQYKIVTQSKEINVTEK